MVTLEPDHCLSEENFEKCPPKADAMIHSLRAIGYDLGMAIADLIDNSIFAGAKTIRVQYSWNNGSPWVRVVDDGRGMSEGTLVEAMTLGSTSPLETREPGDLGRFGLGMKTASFSQCRFVTVGTKDASGVISTRFWDLDHVERSREWLLGKKPDSETEYLLKPLCLLDTGTAVVWKRLDRIDGLVGDRKDDSQEFFLKKFPVVQKYLEMVFHQFLELKRERIRIFVGEAECKPWDPFMLKNQFHQMLQEERFENRRITVTPFVLPHVSNRTPEESNIGSGPNGWNAQQGFYVYRNRRMIVSGGYLDFSLKPEEHYKLARIKVEITNDMDHDWSIDVRKAVAAPPDRLRGELLRIARVTRQKASEVYRARTGKRRRNAPRQNLESVWVKKKVTGGKIVYRINLENPALKAILGEVEPDRDWLRKLCHLLESTVPHRLIIMDGLEHEDCHVDLPEKQVLPPGGLIDLCKSLYLKKVSDGYSHSEAADVTCCMEPFDTHPIYRATVDSLKGE